MVNTCISHIKCGIQLESHITVHRILMNFYQAWSCIRLIWICAFNKYKFWLDSHSIQGLVISSKTSDSVHKLSKNPCTMHPSCQLPSGSSTIYLEWTLCKFLSETLVDWDRAWTRCIIHWTGKVYKTFLNDFNHLVTIEVADHISHIAGELHCTRVLEPFSLIMSLSEV